MQNPLECPLLLVIVGPTATGKSALALQAALQLGGEIVNCDAMQVYSRLEVGTAKPTQEERRLVPHHLYDLVPPDQVYSAGRYMREARRACAGIAGRGRIPIVVGGTGLYLRALLEGIFEGPGRCEELRSRLHRLIRRRGLQRLYRLLQHRDPETARRIQPADRIRIVRALEVYFASGKPLSQLQKNRTPLEGFRVRKVGINLPRELLYNRINRRVRKMFRMGLVEEVEALLADGFPPDCKGFEALGYRYVVRFLRGEISREQALTLTARDTRRYAKRQSTWFRREPDVHWLSTPGEDPRSWRTLQAWMREWEEGKGSA